MTTTQHRNAASDTSNIGARRDGVWLLACLAMGMSRRIGAEYPPQYGHSRWPPAQRTCLSRGNGIRLLIEHPRQGLFIYCPKHRYQFQKRKAGQSWHTYELRGRQRRYHSLANLTPQASLPSKETSCRCRVNQNKVTEIASAAISVLGTPKSASHPTQPSPVPFP